LAKRPIRNERLVCLAGAATLEEYRGKGIYSTMVAKRLEDARALGITSAIIQANKKTSAPICAQLGFEIVCPIDVYVSL
jgi:N-acetylglutamate synthase-like GNAT family acetyltransferase